MYSEYSLGTKHFEVKGHSSISISRECGLSTLCVLYGRTSLSMSDTCYLAIRQLLVGCMYVTLRPVCCSAEMVEACQNGRAGDFAGNETNSNQQTIAQKSVII